MERLEESHRAHPGDQRPRGSGGQARGQEGTHASLCTLVTLAFPRHDHGLTGGRAFRGGECFWRLLPEWTRVTRGEDGATHTPVLGSHGILATRSKCGGNIT